MSHAKDVRPPKITLLIATRKGAFFLHGNRARDHWKLEGPFFLGSIVHHMVLDPRDGKTLLMAASSGHLGPTVFRSTDRGQTWQEASAPPAFPPAAEDEKGESVRFTFWLAPGHVSQPGVWYAGTSQAALFRSADGGDHWEPVEGFNQNPLRLSWLNLEYFEPPGGGLLHSIQIDPRDAAHMYMACSLGGVFESNDGGASWMPLNRGSEADFLPDPEAEYGHDPHALRIHPLDPDILYQQNHIGIYRMQRSAGVWDRIGRNMPPEVGDIGFSIVLHPRDPQTAWVFPMDGTEVWPRTSPGGKPALYRTRDGGQTWKRQSRGLPKKHGYFTIFRQSLIHDGREPLGLYFGTTGGEVWGSRDEGKSWYKLADYLPEIFAIEAVSLPE